MLDASYLANLHELSYEDLKSRRDESLAAEQEISYGRRLLQGKLDILRHAAEAGEKGEGSSLQNVIEQLPAILADPRGGMGAKRHSPIAVPGDSGERRREFERLASEVADIDKMSPDELSEAVRRLEEAERKASEERKRVQDVIDSLNDEIVRRLQETGDGTVPE